MIQSKNWHERVNQVHKGLIKFIKGVSLGLICFSQLVLITSIRCKSPLNKVGFKLYMSYIGIRHTNQSYNTMRLIDLSCELAELD